MHGIAWCSRRCCEAVEVSGKSGRNAKKRTNAGASSFAGVREAAALWGQAPQEGGGGDADGDASDSDDNGNPDGNNNNDNNNNNNNNNGSDGSDDED